MTKWDLDTSQYVLIIHDFQVLGGEGYDTRPGKLWDTEKLKYINNSKLISKDFVILLTPTPTIKYPLSNSKRLSPSKKKVNGIEK